MKDIVIIGGGASPQGKGWGSRIDAADAVIRVWDCKWQLENPDDYGSRWDHGGVTINQGPQFLGWHPGEGPRDWWAMLLVERYRPLFKKLRGLEGVWVFDLTGLAEISKTITPDAPARPMISRGAALAEAAMRYYQNGRLILVGMDNLRAGKMTRSGHKPVNPGRQGKRSVDRYDALADGNLVRYAAHMRGFELVHAEDIWNGE